MRCVIARPATAKMVGYDFISTESSPSTNSIRRAAKRAISIQSGILMKDDRMERVSNREENERETHAFLIRKYTKKAAMPISTK